MQHAVVIYETLYKYLFLFSIAQPIRTLQKATTTSVTRMHRGCGFIQQELQCTYILTLRRVRINTAVMKELKINNNDCLYNYCCLTSPVCKTHAPYHIVISEMSGCTKRLNIITYTAKYSLKVFKMGKVISFNLQLFFCKTFHSKKNSVRYHKCT